MWSIALIAVKSFLAAIFTGWLARREQQKEVSDAAEPYKKELEIKNRPAGSDDDLLGRM